MRLLPAGFALLIVAGCSKQLPNQQASVGNDGRGIVTRLPPDPFGWPIVTAADRRVGTVFTRSDKQGNVIVSLDTAGLPPGTHGVRIYEAPKCEGPKFESAGGHWARKGNHSGDLGNLTVSKGGRGEAKFMVPSSNWDAKRSGPFALIIHASADEASLNDEKSDERIACGLFYVRRD